MTLKETLRSEEAMVIEKCIYALPIALAVALAGTFTLLPWHVVLSTVYGTYMAAGALALLVICSSAAAAVATIRKGYGVLDAIMAAAALAMLIITIEYGLVCDVMGRFTRLALVISSLPHL